MQQKKWIKKLSLGLTMATLLISMNMTYASFISDIEDALSDIPHIYDQVVQGVEDLGSIVTSFGTLLEGLTKAIFVDFGSDLSGLLTKRNLSLQDLSGLEQTAKTNAISTGQTLTSTAFTEDPFKNQLSSYAAAQSCSSGSGTCSTDANSLLSQTSISNTAQSTNLLQNMSGASVGYQKLSSAGNKPTPEAVKYAAFSNSQSAMYSLSASNISSIVTKRTAQTLSDGKTQRSALEQNVFANVQTLFGAGTDSISSAFSGITSAFGQIFQLFYFAQSAVSHLGEIADMAEKSVTVMSSLLNMGTMAMQMSFGDQMLQSAEQSMSNIGKKSASD